MLILLHINQGYLKIGLTINGFIDSLMIIFTNASKFIIIRSSNISFWKHLQISPFLVRRKDHLFEIKMLRYFLFYFWLCDI